MGLLTRVSILVLIIAVSTPLLYRRFATDDSVKVLSSYHPNFKLIDQFLRQSASQIDQAKDYLPDKKQIEIHIENLQRQANNLFEKVRNQIEQLKANGSDKRATNSDEKRNDGEKPTQASSFKLSSCPGEEQQVRLWSKDELAKYDGTSSNEIYLGFLGLVYNVTANAQHYGPGTEYSAFAGRDATRAFVTGNFTHDLTDDIADIEDSYYTHVESWASFYSSSYPALGRIEGAFFDPRGCGTPELGRVYEIFNKLAQERAKYQEENKQLPECNNEWNSDLNSGRVWCGTKSGGVERDWIGVPRLIEDETSNRCVCVNLEARDASELSKFKIYPGCDPNSTECAIKQ